MCPIAMLLPRSRTMICAALGTVSPTKRYESVRLRGQHGQPATGRNETVTASCLRFSWLCHFITVTGLMCSSCLGGFSVCLDLCTILIPSCNISAPRTRFICTLTHFAFRPNGLMTAGSCYPDCVEVSSNAQGLCSVYFGVTVSLECFVVSF